ncbi:hypothetical protein M1506_01620 [Patescibacteria group bacterium]|nr:hypothetical protein [Patescibacteria group bacterium]
MRQCAVCGKSYKMGGTRIKLRGKFNPTNWTKKQANLQWARIPDVKKRVLVCTKCIKTLNKKKPKTLRAVV